MSWSSVDESFRTHKILCAKTIRNYFSAHHNNNNKTDIGIQRSFNKTWVKRVEWNLAVFSASGLLASPHLFLPFDNWLTRLTRSCLWLIDMFHRYYKYIFIRSFDLSLARLRLVSWCLGFCWSSNWGKKYHSIFYFIMKDTVWLGA